MHASRNATGKTPGTWAGASEQAVEAPHLPERAKTPRRPALEGFEALGDAGLESASVCGLGAEGPVRSGLFDEADVTDGDLFADFLGQESLDPTRGLEVSLGRADRGHD